MNPAILDYSDFDLVSDESAINKETQTDITNSIASCSFTNKPQKPPENSNDESCDDNSVKVFEFCKIVTDKSSNSISLVKERYTEEVHKHSEDEDAASNRSTYCREVIKPYLKDYPQDCEELEESVIKDLLVSAQEDFPDYQPCYDKALGTSHIVTKESTRSSNSASKPPQGPPKMETGTGSTEKASISSLHRIKDGISKIFCSFCPSKAPIPPDPQKIVPAPTPSPQEPPCPVPGEIRPCDPDPLLTCKGITNCLSTIIFKQPPLANPCPKKSPSVETLPRPSKKEPVKAKKPCPPKPCPPKPCPKKTPSKEIIPAASIKTEKPSLKKPESKEIIPDISKNSLRSSSTSSVKAKPCKPKKESCATLDAFPVKVEASPCPSKQESLPCPSKKEKPPCPPKKEKPPCPPKEKSPCTSKKPDPCGRSESVCSCDEITNPTIGVIEPKCPGQKAKFFLTDKSKVCDPKQCSHTMYVDSETETLTFKTILSNAIENIRQKTKDAVTMITAENLRYLATTSTAECSTDDIPQNVEEKENQTMETQEPENVNLFIPENTLRTDQSTGLCIPITPMTFITGLVSRVSSLSEHVDIYKMSDNIKERVRKSGERSSPYDKPVPPTEMSNTLLKEPERSRTGVFSNIKSKIFAIFSDSNKAVPAIDSDSTSSKSSKSSLKQQSSDDDSDMNLINKFIE